MAGDRDNSFSCSSGFTDLHHVGAALGHSSDDGD